MIKNLLAAGGGPPGGNPITNPGLGTNLQGILAGGGGVYFFQLLIPRLIGWAFVIGTTLFVFMLLIGSVQWITSGGDKNALEAARGRISQALIGVIVLFSVFAIIKLIEVFFGISILAIDIGPLII